MAQHRGTILGLLGLALLVCVAYLPALHAGFVWDDREYVSENPNLVRPDGLQRIWFDPRHMVQYYPMVHTVLRVEHRLWGLRPAGYHAVNILLQVLNAFLLWCILRRLAVPGAWLIAALFGVHPLQVESVAWVTELKNLLSGAFYFAAVLAYLRFAGLTAAPPVRGRNAPAAARPPRFYALSLGLFVLALCSKTTVVTLPVVLLVLLWWKKPLLARRDLLPLVPMVALAAAFGAFTWWLETFHVGSEKVLALTTWERLLLPGRVAWFYFGKLLWPVPQSFIYTRWHADPGVWWQWLYPLGVVAVVAVLWRQRQRWGKGPLAAVLFYLLTLVPVSGALRFYFQLYSFVGDHFQYLACIGLLAALVAPAARWASSRRQRQLPAALRYGVPAAVLVALTALTWNRTQVFRSEESLWRDTVAKNPAAWIAHNNLGVACRQQRRTAEAERHFTAALQINANSPEALANLGDIYKERGEVERAIATYRQAVAMKPELFATQYALGMLLMQGGRTEEAVPCFTAALRYRPQMAEACMMLGDICVARQQLAAAVQHYRDALVRDPSLAKVYSRLGWVYTNLGSYTEANSALLDAVRLDPADAHAQALLGFVLEKRGDAPGARRQYQRALQLNPRLDLATEGMGRLSAAQP